MILDNLQKITEDCRRKKLSDDYIKNQLKEYLQIYVLNFIYTSNDYTDKFIFNGGTCLRHIYDLGRLSEDVDFDTTQEFSANAIKDELLEYFKKRYLFENVTVSVHQKGRQIRLKFAILQNLGLAAESESDLLYVKMDIARVLSKSFNTITTLGTKEGFNFIITHYDLPSLMAGKISAILTRSRFVGAGNKEVIKGRDYFDLMWYLQKQVVPNFDFVRGRIGEDISDKEIIKRVEDKVGLATTKRKNDFKTDLVPFVENTEILDKYIDTYSNAFKDKSRYLLLSVK